MSPNPDRETRIKRLAEAESRTRRALIKLQNAGRAISFTAVAMEASVSTSFLYQHAELRAEIAQHRSYPLQRARPQLESASAASLRTKLGVALRRNRQLTDQLANLSAENSALRSQLLAAISSRPR